MVDSIKRPDPEQILFNFFTEVGIISQLATAMFERSLPAGLTSSQFSVLNWFTRVDKVASPGRLATAFQVTPGAMTNTLKKLEAKGFIKIEPDTTNGRQKLVTMTASGRKMREQGIKSAAPVFAEFGEQFSAKKIEKQLQGLQEVRKYLDEARYRGLEN